MSASQHAHLVLKHGTKVTLIPHMWPCPCKACMAADSSLCLGVSMLSPAAPFQSPQLGLVRQT